MGTGEKKNGETLMQVCWNMYPSVEEEEVEKGVAAEMKETPAVSTVGEQGAHAASQESEHIELINKVSSGIIWS
jgi:hypothetical protein